MKCDLAEFNLTDIFLLLGLNKRTGELVIESGNNIGSIEFHEGRILRALSPYSRAIGDLLVEGGLITEEELVEMLKVQKKGEHLPLGGLFVKSGRIRPHIIEVMVQEQIRQSVKEFLSWNQPRVNFVAKEIRSFDGIHLAVHEFVEAHTLESAKAFFTAMPGGSRVSSPSAKSVSSG